MRTYNDAKTMAKTLRDSLAARSVLLSHSECLEIVAKQFGLADWNTLSAKLDRQVSRIATHEQIFCSFCDKSQHEVRSLIEGGCRNPTLSQCVFICDECVTFSAQVIADTVGNIASPQDLAVPSITA